jgi:hypothetical protein
VAFVAPWFPVSMYQDGGMLNGFQVVGLFSFTAFYEIINFESFLFSISSILLLAGFLSIHAYIILALIRAFTMNRVYRKWWLSVSLSLGTTAMLVLTILLSNGYGGFNRCEWGYWLTWVGLTSSILLEFVAWRLYCWRRKKVSDDLTFDLR